MVTRSDFIPRQSRNAISRRVRSGSMTIVRLDNDDYFFEVDGIMAQLWSIIDGRQTLESIKDQLVQMYDPPISDFEKHVDQFIAELIEERLLESV